MEEKKIFITGASGFIGKNLLNIISGSRWTAYCLTRNLSGKKNTDNIQWITYEEINHTFKKNKISTALNLATSYGHDHKIGELIKTNIEMPISILEIAIKYKCPLFITADSYFTKSDATYEHMKEYVKSKKELLEWIRLTIKTKKEIRVVNARLEHVYGPYDGAEKFTSKLIEDLNLNRETDLTAGEQRRDFIYVDDVVSAFITLINNSSKMAEGLSSLDIGTGISTTVKNFTKKAAEIFESKSKLNFGKIDYRIGEIMDSVADTSILNQLGWKPVDSYKTGLMKMKINNDKN